MNLSDKLGAYSTLTATAQAIVREEVFDRLIELGIQYDRTHARGEQITAEVQFLVDWAQTNSAGFVADGTAADAQAELARLDNKVASYANAHPRISGATRS